MDIEKVIEILNDTESDMEYTKKEINEAYLLTIQVLEKQIPKEPDNDGHNTPFSYYCPVCREELSDGGWKPSEKYCPNCGQRIVNYEY